MTDSSGLWLPSGLSASSLFSPCEPWGPTVTCSGGPQGTPCRYSSPRPWVRPPWSVVKPTSAERRPETGLEPGPVARQVI